MEMYQGEVPVYVLPEGAYCKADKEGRSPVDLDYCPAGYDKCDPDCYFYVED